MIWITGVVTEVFRYWIAFRSGYKILALCNCNRKDDFQVAKLFYIIVETTDNTTLKGVMVYNRRNRWIECKIAKSNFKNLMHNIYYLNPSSVVDYCNRPFMSCPKPLFQSEATREATDMKIIFYSHVNKVHFHNKGLVLSLLLKVAFLELGNGLSLFLSFFRLIFPFIYLAMFYAFIQLVCNILRKRLYRQSFNLNWRKEGTKKALASMVGITELPHVRESRCLCYFIIIFYYLSYFLPLNFISEKRHFVLWRLWYF